MEQQETTDIDYVDKLNCTHESTSWVEEMIEGARNAHMVGYQCDYCGEWVDEDE